MKNREIIGKLRMCAKNLLDVVRELQAMDRVESPRTEELIEKVVASSKGGVRTFDLPLALGKDDFGKDVIMELARLPHLLIGGTSGCGKTACLNSLLAGLIGTKTPEDVRFIIYDPKCVEFVWASGLPHLAAPVINEALRMVLTLSRVACELERRLAMFARVHCRNIVEFNGRNIGGELPTDVPRTVPFIVVVIDELAGLMLEHGKETVRSIARITARGRAAGIHLVAATSCLDRTVVTGSREFDIRGRLAFRTLSDEDSRTIINDVGAEQLNARGEFMFRNGSEEIVRGQGAYVADGTMARIVEDAKRKYGKPDYGVFKMVE